MGNETILLNDIRKAVETLDFFELRKTLNDAINAGVSNQDIITKGILEGINKSGEIGLIIAAEALRKELKEISYVPNKKLGDKHQFFAGKVVIGTIKGDIHDLGKNILIALLKSMGIDVEDLGVDVPSKVFVESAKSAGVKVIALSGLLSTVIENIKHTIHALEEAGLRKKLKIIIGGAGTSQELADEVNADAYAEDAVKGLEIIKNWVEVNEK